MEETRNLVLCGHCDQLVSRSTRNRHANKRTHPHVLRRSYQNIVVESSESNDSDTDTQFSAGKCNY